MAGHSYGHVYIGAIGLVLTYFFHGRDKAKNLVQNCLNCQACKAVCAAGIDLPRLIKEVHARIQDEEGHDVKSTMIGKLLANRGLFHTMLKAASIMQKPMAKGGYVRHLPLFFTKDHGFRSLPALADKPFREMWPKLKPTSKGAGPRVAIFSGCVQDFVYPEQVEAAVKVMATKGVDMDFPMGQTCCGLPAVMMGEKAAAKDVAAMNIAAIDPASYDYILTMCASCASHLKHGYLHLTKDDPKAALKARQFADKVIDFSSFVRDVLKLDESAFRKTGIKAAYHAPCHLCRGMGVTEAPRAMINIGGAEYLPAEEEDVCCGFGGTFSIKFPELSAEILNKKLTRVEETGATELLTDCPGCIMQLRGGLDVRKSHVKCRHVAELLADNLK